MCDYLVCLPPFFSYPTSLLLCFVSCGVIVEWLLVVEAIIVFGSGVAGLSVPFPRAHSTHDCLHSTFPRLQSPWSVGFSRLPVNPHTGFGLWMSHTEMSSNSSCAPSFYSFAHIGDSLFCFLTMVDSRA